jgi:putative hydroxymethylpyrimidine transporter CytX
VPERLRVLGTVDSLLLWGNLSVSLLVIVIGALLVPALSLQTAMLAILVGAVVGNVLLGIAAAIGADARVPGMVVLRAPLGQRGSWLPTAFNVVQNVGWSTFELIIIATAAAAASERIFGWQGKWLWTLLFGALSWALGMLGPIGFVRRYLRKVASWALIFSMAYLTYWAVSKAPLHGWNTPGTGNGPTFGQAVDLVIASIVSWTPLAADYTRFAKTRRGAGLGAGIGYFVPTIWCVGLGCLIALSREVTDPSLLPGAVAAAGGIAFLALIAVTIDESEKAFADIYSTAVSLQNLFPRVSQRLLITLVSLLATGLALVLSFGGSFENFLLLLGSFFVPLLGVLIADWLLAGCRYSEERFFAGPNWRPAGLIAWAVGFGLYQWLSPVGPVFWTKLVDRTHPGKVTFTASLPSFAAAFLVMVLLTLALRVVTRRDRTSIA